MIVPVLLNNETASCPPIKIYALLDPQSDSCFISETAAERVNATGPSITLKLSTMLGDDAIQCNKISGLRIKSLDQSVDISIPGSYTRKLIPADHGQIPKKETIAKWPHLAKVADRLYPYDEHSEIGLLLGGKLYTSPQT
jgi:hypothetical protein